MIQTSEYCAVGHPDRTCDYVASYILDRHLERDPYARVALEVQLKDCFCTLSGEITSRYRFTGSELAEFCREAIRRIGYTDEYLAQWGEGNVISGSGLEVVTHISRQSEDIAQGVNREGWGDQGIFWGLAVDDPSRGNMPKDYWLARMVAQELYLRRFGGLDVKTQVTVEDGLPVECVVAIPIRPECEEAATGTIRNYVQSILGSDCRVIVNGTGRYVKHGSIGDCGTTGRKLVADFYGGNSKIGGQGPEQGGRDVEHTRPREGPGVSARASPRRGALRDQLLHRTAGDPSLVLRQGGQAPRNARRERAAVARRRPARAARARLRAGLHGGAFRK